MLHELGVDDAYLQKDALSLVSSTVTVHAKSAETIAIFKANILTMEIQLSFRAPRTSVNINGGSSKVS